MFIGKEQSSDKVLFVLELLADDLEKVIEISENGEIYLKADTIVSLPKQEEFPSLETLEFSFVEDKEHTYELFLARGMRPPKAKAGKGKRCR